MARYDQLHLTPIAVPDDGTLAPQEDCEALAKQVVLYGLCSISTNRVTTDICELIHETSYELFTLPEDVREGLERPKRHYESGMTPAYQEGAKDRTEQFVAIPSDLKPTLIEGNDPKMRWMEPVGPRPARSKYPLLNTKPVPVPMVDGFSRVQQFWGKIALGVLKPFSIMLARGLGLPPLTFWDKLHEGPHLNGFTGYDMTDAPVGTGVAKAHDDMGFGTFHTNSSTPGLLVWDRPYEHRYLVRMPPATMLFQAGQQLEYITGGHVFAGLHEVLVCEEALAFIAECKRLGRRAIRSSINTFTHFRSDEDIGPIGHFRTPEVLVKYPSIEAGEHSNRELKAIGLALEE